MAEAGVFFLDLRREEVTGILPLGVCSKLWQQNVSTGRAQDAGNEEESIRNGKGRVKFRTKKARHCLSFDPFGCECDYFHVSVWEV
ncbi:hypothetical protein CEXT_161111 [Caerostris extrusa]|uniref:Uncharacterized protein n=1 Tax=Caerostris extrusa TaxID=172846 RepID=A0AAV4TF81_CAEEX|nr:hypothetical protein CEXT_161111 [Caerostris extrusa]